MSAPDVRFGDWSPEDPGFVASILSTVVFKCLIQGYLIAAGQRYFSLIPVTKDGMKQQTLVVTLISLDFAHTAVSVAKLYLVAVDRVCWRTHWLNAFDTTMTGIICSIAQGFFARRCWRIEKNSPTERCIIAFVATGVVAGTIGMIVTTWLAYGQIPLEISILQDFIYLWTISSAFFEFVITVIFFRYFWKFRCAFQPINEIIIRLSRMGIESSSPCFLFMIALAVTVFAKNVSSNFFAFSSASLYGLSVMETLNGREKIRSRFSGNRPEEALITFGATQTNGTTESHMFSEEGLATVQQRRTSQGVGHDSAEQYCRPSILSVAKEIMRPTPSSKIIPEA